MDDVVGEGTGVIIRSATGVAVSNPDTSRGRALETAMLIAVQEAYAEGISDPAQIKSRIDAALETARAEE